MIDWHNSGTIVPFLLGAGKPQPKFSLQRILEGLIIASLAGIVSATASVYVTQHVLATEIVNLTANIQQYQSTTDYRLDRLESMYIGKRIK